MNCVKCISTRGERDANESSFAGAARGARGAGREQLDALVEKATQARTEAMLAVLTKAYLPYISPYFSPTSPLDLP